MVEQQYIPPQSTKSNAGWIILIIIIIVLGIALPTKQIICSREITKTEMESQPYTATEYYYESEPYTDKECEDKTLVYSVTDFNINSDCLDYNERCLDYTFGICTEKETFCVEKQIKFGLKLNNFDDERGNWIVNINLYLNDISAGSKTQNVFLYPKESRDVYWTFGISGEEDCKKKITGSYNIQDEPKKQVCNDIIKYRDVQKSKQVTKFKDVEVTKQVQEEYKKKVNWIFGRC